MNISIHSVIPDRFVVLIREFKNFFTVEILVSSRDVYVDVEESNQESDVDSLEFVDINDSEELSSTVESTYYSEHSICFFVSFEKANTQVRDQILTKLKLSFPNHQYELVGEDLLS